MSERILYILYIISWKKSHKGKEFKGCKWVCFNEWKDCELKEMQHHPDWYIHSRVIKWLIENTKEKNTRCMK